MPYQVKQTFVHDNVLYQEGHPFLHTETYESEGWMKTLEKNQFIEKISEDAFKKLKKDMVVTIETSEDDMEDVTPLPPSGEIPTVEEKPEPVVEKVKKFRSKAQSEALKDREDPQL